VQEHAAAEGRRAAQSKGCAMNKVRGQDARHGSELQCDLKFLEGDGQRANGALTAGVAHGLVHIVFRYAS